MLHRLSRKFCPRNVYFTLTVSPSSSRNLISSRNALNNCSGSFGFFNSSMGINQISPFSSVSRTPNLTKTPLSVRSYCSGNWSEDVEYLDESGSVIYSGKGVRSVEPGLDDHVMVGGLKKPILNASAVAKIVEVVKRWKWGPELENQLDKLQFVPNMTHIIQAMKVVKDSDASLSLFRWAKRQSCLPYKAFEIYESMQAAGCLLDGSTYELMIPSLAKSGRLDAAVKLFQEMKERKFWPSFSIFASLVDSMGKAGRLDTSMKMYTEMQSSGFRPSATMFVSLIESYAKAGKLDTALQLWSEMKSAGFRPNFGLYSMIIESHAKSGKLDTATSIFKDMEKAGFLPTPSTYSCLLEMHAASGQVDSAMKLYNSMINAGLRPGLSTYTAILTLLANKKLVDVAAKILLEMKSMGFSVDVSASDVLMVYIKDGSIDLALRWLRFMDSSGIRTNSFIVRQLFESCMKNGLYESAKPLLETYVNSSAKVDLVLYTSILAYLVRCQEENDERHLMAILSATKHKAHAFMCGLFTGPEQRKQPVLSFVREFFQSLDYELEEGAARYFVNVLLNYLVLMGQINRARCVWKVAYENKLFPKAIVFDQQIAWSLDVRNLSVGAALIAVVHTLHRFRKRMLYYGVIPRRIKLVTGPTLRIVVAQMLSSVESPFEVSKVVLRATGDSVMEWFKKPIVQQFLLNEIPSRSDILMHRLNILFPSSAPEIRSLSPPKPLISGKAL
ncbi:hypothetical protein CCACVL1_22332 [Corchorus capsularis]|uniref:Smr domain-containing protein n=1 Tax=Corchorus capsularis TaxID=210143 RepID=A0A1R3H0E0_COCAP|nr:hypothetical protein CCACVL1_22332 [Corchorus capsularis]